MFWYRTESGSDPVKESSVRTWSILRLTL